MKTDGKPVNVVMKKLLSVMLNAHKSWNNEFYIKQNKIELQDMLVELE